MYIVKSYDENFIIKEDHKKLYLKIMFINYNFP